MPIRKNNSKFRGLEEAKRQQELKDKEAALKQQEADIARRMDEMNVRGPGYRAVSQTEQEKKAGVLPPGFEGMRDLKTGELLSQYKFDPYQSQAIKALQEQAFAQGDSPWAKMQLEKQAAEQAGARDQAMRSQAQGLAQAQGNLLRTGGLSSGARTRMAMQGARDLSRAQQDVNRQGMLSRFGIQEQDISRKQQLLGGLGETDLRAQEANLNALKSDVQRGQEFDFNRYGKQMEAYGAQQTAAAQRAAAGGGGKCFDGLNDVIMADLTLKKVCALKIGDELLAGGKILGIRKYTDKDGFSLYNYGSALLTGSHAVKENGAWIRVEDSKNGYNTHLRVTEVYGLVTENHVVLIGPTLFADDVETNEDVKDEKMSLKLLNKELLVGG